MVLSLIASNATAAGRVHDQLLQRIGRILDRIDRERRCPNKIETYYLLNVMDDVVGGRFSAIEDSMLRAEAALKATPHQILSFKVTCPITSTEEMRARLDALADETGR